MVKPTLNWSLLFDRLCFLRLQSLNQEEKEKKELEPELVDLQKTWETTKTSRIVGNKDRNRMLVNNDMYVYVCFTAV